VPAPEICQQLSISPGVNVCPLPFWWGELDPWYPRLTGRRNSLAVGVHVVVQENEQQVPRMGVVKALVGRSWCNVAFDESGTELVSELGVRVRTNWLRVLTFPEGERIRKAAARRTALMTSTSDRSFGELPPGGYI
jgi:hypothetical protein